MNQMDFTEFMKKSGFRVEGRLAYGSVDGYPVLMKRERFGRITILFYLEDVNWKELREPLLEYAALYKSSIYFEEPHLVWKTKVGRREYTRFSEMMQGIARVLKKAEQKRPCTCVICGQAPSDSFAVINEGNQPVHRECLQAQLEYTREKRYSGSYLLGIIGGILGCLAGSIPSVLAMLWAGRTYCVLFLCIPPAIYYGCKWLHGKMDWLVFFLSVLLSFASVYVMEFAVRIQYNLLDQQLPVTWHYIWQVLEKLLECEGIWGIVTRSGGINFLFVLMGILINWELISQTSLKAEENVVSVINTIN